MLPSPKTIEDSMVLVNADPQINAPNMTLTNNPTASRNTYHYPRVQYPQGAPMNTPRMTVMPPKEVSPDAYQNWVDQKGVYRENNTRKLKQTSGVQVMPPQIMLPQMGAGSAGGSPQNFDVNKITQQVIANLKKTNKDIEVFNPNAPPTANMPSRHRRHRRNRHLSGNGFFNAGPGFVDVGSMGMNNVNLATANPNMSSMGPFMPQVNPPSPIRIRIKDPWTEKRKKKLLSQSMKMMYKVMIQNKFDAVSDSLAGLADQMDNFRSQVMNKMADLNNAELETSLHISKANSSAELVPEMIRQKYNLS